MKRRNLSPKENAANININGTYGLKHQIIRTRSVVDDFYFEKCNPSSHKDESVSVVDPIHLLFNQQRLSNLGQGAAQKFLDSLQPQSNALAELRQKCSDDDLMQMIKSRYLQSPAEILCWCREMQRNVDKFNSEVAKLVAEQQAKEVETKPDVEPAKVE